MSKIKSVTIDWGRSLIIDSTLDDELIKQLMPKILALRQESNDPITVGIDSPGGSLESLNVLIDLLTGPDQNGKTGDIITVATYRAYSAAASFLAFGTYAVALRHAQILYHDVRLGGIKDVTPEKARMAAKSLQEMNDEFALRLAERTIRRLIWIYIDLMNNFEEIRNAFPFIYDRYYSIVSAYAPIVEDHRTIDLASFATALWARLSPQNDKLIGNVMGRLERWINLTRIVKDTPTYRHKGSRTPGLLDGARLLNKHLSGRTDRFQSSEESLKLIISLIVAEVSGTKTERVHFSAVLDRATREYGILTSMNDTSHVQRTMDLMLKNPYFFFNKNAAEIKDMPEPEKSEMYTRATPYAILLWHFCVLLCRELFEGEHVFKPFDAQLIGLIDEVSGGSEIQSRRDYRIARAKNKESAKAPSAG